MKNVKKLLILVGGILGLSMMTSVMTDAATNDSLFSQINDEGTIIDGNKTAIKFDKPVIRPTYLGRDIFGDYTGPNGVFEGVWEGKPGGRPSYYGHEILVGKPTIIRNIGYYKQQPLALKINHTIKTPSWLQTVTLRSDGGLAISPQVRGTEFQLVYNDGVFITPVEDVYVEMPIMSLPSVKNETYDRYSHTAIKTDNLKRYIFHEQGDRTNVIKNIVSRQQYQFNSGIDGELYNAEALHIEHRFTRAQTGGIDAKEIGNTVVFDNNTPLTFANRHVVSTSAADVLFKSNLKTPGEISYLSPRTNGIKNTDKLEVNFDLTQGLNDGFVQYFPESMSVMMEDTEHMFNNINLTTIKFTNNEGQDISNKVSVSEVNTHLYEFKVSKENLMALGSDQLNIFLSADNLNNKKILEEYNPEKQVYEVPIVFYNYKVYKGVKTESDRVRTTSEISPNIYGEAVDGITATQYTQAQDLDIDKLLKNVATTIPDDTLALDFVNPDMHFDKVQTYEVPIKIQSIQTGINKIINVPVSIIAAVPVTSGFFENQQWLINYLNAELFPKKIDLDMYMTDLLKVKVIDEKHYNSKATIGEHIPKNIKALKNLEILKWSGMTLTGTLPTELGALEKLKHLDFTDNELKGELPRSVTKLFKLEALRLNNNQLTGVLPTTLTELNNLIDLSIGNNQFVGIIPSFSADQLECYDVSGNQVTVNSNESPSYGTSTFLPELTLIPNENYTFLNGAKNISVSEDGTMIKPFEPTNEGFFDLFIEAKNSKEREELFLGHTFMIKSLSSNEIVYEGAFNKDVSFVANVDESFEVTMDGATKNENNRHTIKSKLREIKIQAYPKKMTLKLQVGNLSKERLELGEGESLKIFDNRVNSTWELRAKTSELSGAGKLAKGSFYYKSKKGIEKKLSVSGYTTIEAGTSQIADEIIDVSKDWDDVDGTGLFYQQATTDNYRGAYTGKVYWQLFDGPSGQ